MKELSNQFKDWESAHNIYTEIKIERGLEQDRLMKEYNRLSIEYFIKYEVRLNPLSEPKDKYLNS